MFSYKKFLEWINDDAGQVGEEQEVTPIITQLKTEVSFKSLKSGMLLNAENLKHRVKKIKRKRKLLSMRVFKQSKDFIVPSTASNQGSSKKKRDIRKAS